MITVEVDNRSGLDVDEVGAVELAGRVLRPHAVTHTAHAGRADSPTPCAVSYTHLTLPTICSV